MAGQLSASLQLPRLFFKWWLGELAGFVPRILRPSPITGKPGLVLDFRGDEIILTKQTARRGGTELARAVDSDPNELRAVQNAEAFAGLGERHNRRLPITARLASHLGMRRLIELPLSAKDDLHQLLAFELDRLTPFKADNVYFAWRIKDADSKTGRMKVALEVAPKVIVDRALDLASAHGRDIDRVELECTGTDCEPLDLLPRNHGDKPAGNWLSRLLRLTTLILLAVAIALPIRKQMTVIDRLEAEIATVRALAEESLVLREQLAFISDEAGFLADTRSSRPTMTEALAELTRLIPDQSHMLQLRISDRSVDLNGLAEKASDLLAILDESPMLTSPRFKSPVTKDQRSGKERFQISVDLLERPS
ncbi:MAG: PilN domain-containing protein [Geminicoccaceae bacterium]